MNGQLTLDKRFHNCTFSCLSLNQHIVVQNSSYVVLGSIRFQPISEERNIASFISRFFNQNIKTSTNTDSQTLFNKTNLALVLFEESFFNTSYWESDSFYDLTFTSDANYSYLINLIIYNKISRNICILYTSIWKNDHAVEIPEHLYTLDNISL